MQPLIFQTMNQVQDQIVKFLKYQKFTPSGCKKILGLEIEFVMNTQLRLSEKECLQDCYQHCQHWFC